MVGKPGTSKTASDLLKAHAAEPATVSLIDVQTRTRITSVTGEVLQSFQTWDHSLSFHAEEGVKVLKIY